MFIVPINSDGYIGRRANILLTLIALNALALVATYVSPLPADQVFLQYGFIPANPRFWTALTSMFLHVGFWHFAGNVFFLWMFGYRVENTFGPWLFALVYLLSGFGAVGLHFAFNKGSNIPCVGASGAISGIVGCYFVLFPKSQFDMVVVFLRWPVRTIRTDTRSAVGAWIAEQLLLGMLTTVGYSSVAFWGHVGGFITGAALTALIMLVHPQIKRQGEMPLVVRIVRGVVHDGAGRPAVGALFEIRGNSHSTFTAPTDSKGRFIIPSVPDGIYSFRLSKSSLETMEGTLLVRRKRPPLSSLRFIMRLAEPNTPTEIAEAAYADKR